MAHTCGSNTCGKRSRFIARTFETKEAHCQSKYEAVGKLSSAALFDSPNLRSMNKPSIRLHAGPICRFQNTGTTSSGGLVQSRSVLLGMNNTLPPWANFFSASSHERVIKMSCERERGQSEFPVNSAGTTSG